MAADVVGYSRMMGANEAGTLTALKVWHRDIVQPLMTCVPKIRFGVDAASARRKLAC
jgi:hypothetical protein